MLLAYLLAVLASGSNAVSNVLQRKADKEEPPELAMSPKLILDLLHRPVWLAGFGAVVLSFLLDASALSMGRLAAVQPVLVLELPMTLLLASRVFRVPIRTLEWSAIAVMTAGLVGLIVFMSPSAPHHGVPALHWILGVAATVGAVAACVVMSSRAGSARRAAFLGLAAGISFGLTAAFMKSATHALGHGAAAVFETWPTYAMVASGLSAMFLMQNALQAGRLIAAQPGITLADPAVSILWGVIAFGEGIRGGLFYLGDIASGLFIATGVVLLSQSRLLEDQMMAADSSSGRNGDAK